MADDHAPPRPAALDIETDEGLSNYVENLFTRVPIPERLRYPETPEAFEAAIVEARASGYVPAEDVERWVRSLGTANPLPRPRCD